MNNLPSAIPIVSCHYGNTSIKHLTYKTTLKIFLTLFIFLTIFLVSCSIDTHPKNAVNFVKLRTSNKHIQSNFDSCLQLTQQLIMTQISDKEFAEYFSLNKRATGFEYNNVVQDMSDSLFQLPKTYQIFYDFVYKADTITTFRADFDSITKIIDYRNFHLLAFRQFIDKKFTVTRAEATTIALNNGMKSQDLELIFNCSADKFYWQCKNDCDGCLYLDIDAKSGKIIGQGKVVYQY